MHIRPLKESDLEDLVFAILLSFEGYFVTMPTELSYWKNRYQAARVVYELSFGYFAEGQIVGFIINGIDEWMGKKTAFNTGTGVVPKYRGQGIVDQLYQYAHSHFAQHGIQQYALEVVQENTRAIRVYERIGFSIIKSYACFAGTIDHSNKQTTLKATTLEAIQNAQSHWYAWDNCDAAIQNAVSNRYQIFEVLYNNQAIGFFVIHPESGYLAQFECYSTPSASWERLFDGIGQINTTLKIININTQRTELITALEGLGLQNSINQFEMLMPI